MEKDKIKLASVSDCTGCGACGDVCPKGCISFAAKETLHLYPEIDNEQCIRCGRCRSVCPIISPIAEQSDFNDKYYAAWSDDPVLRAASTSGGVASAIARVGIESGWMICGAVFDNKWQLYHEIGNDQKFLEKFRQSKYIQSDMRGMYIIVSELLKGNNKVMFFGTPCQVAAVRKVCGGSDNLLTVEIICHGVNSPMVWQDYVRNLEKKHHSELIKYNFRDKSRGWQRRNGTPNLGVSMQFADHKAIVTRARYNQFHYWFGQHLMLRQACFNCRYRTLDRVGDIVVGDFWGVQKIIPGIDTKRGVSIAIARNPEAVAILDTSRCNLIEVKGEDTVKVLKGFTERRSQALRDKEIERMQRFTDEYLRSSFEEMAGRYPAPTKFEYFKERIKFLFKS